MLNKRLRNIDKEEEFWHYENEFFLKKEIFIKKKEI
jgi:hypothetical protein